MNPFPACNRTAALCITIFLLATSAITADSPVQHLVLFQFQEDTSDAEVRALLEEFDPLPAKVPGVAGFQWGVNNSPEGLSKGFTHGFIVTFKDTAARDAYFPHPAHEAFVARLRPKLAKAFALDFSVPDVLPPAEPGRTHHLVFFKFKQSASEEEIDRVNAAFAALQRQVSGLLHYQAGPNNLSRDLNDGFTHGYLLTFIHERARNDYLPHPAHKAFGGLVGPLLEDVLVLDFTVVPSSRRLFVTHGLEPFRVYQRDANGVASIQFGGVSRDDGAIEARLRAGRRTVKNFDWKVVGEARNGVFEAALEGVPTGGEYTVEVRRRDALGNVAEHTEVADILVGDIWILAGQSNMQGVGDLEDVEEPSPMVHCFTMGHRWELAKEPLHWLVDSPDPVHSGGRLRGLDEDGRRRARAQRRKERQKGAGLGLPFAKELAERTGVPLGLIAAAHGGTSMEQWDPAGRDRGGETLYGSMYKQVENAGGKVRGVLWYQGESDANPQAVPLFADRFKSLVAAFRRDFNTSDLPFYYVQIGRFVIDRPSESWDRIQELQRLAEKEMLATAMISVLDLPLDDLIHVGTDGLKRAGRRLAKIAHRELFGQRELERGPHLAAVKAAADGRTIRVVFSEVNGRLFPSRKVEGFSVHGNDGSPLNLIYNARVDPESPNTVLLKLRGPVPADAHLHYGRGLNPVCNLVDAEDMAAPAFGPVEIERE